MNIVVITPSRNKLDKFDAIINGTKTISFGARGMSDFTIHKDEARKTPIPKQTQKEGGLGRCLFSWVL